ncbi:MAG: DUF2778 domain-containing protein [Afipia sp.]|nr:DUF2778 domain-containing protein [Afipia sp.]
MRYSVLAYDTEVSPAQSFRKAFSVTLGFAALVLATLAATWALYTYIGGLSLSHTSSDLRTVAFARAVTFAKSDTRPPFDAQAQSTAFNERFISRSDDVTASLPPAGRFDVAYAAAPEILPPEPEATPAPSPPPKPAEVASIPLPAEKPASLRARMKDSIVRKEIALANKAATLTASAKSVFERLFGKPESGPQLAYAGSDGGILSGNDDKTAEVSLKPPFSRDTAVYDITAKKVYLPDGTELEAHSGLGDKLDDPRFVSLRMRGATPPHVYDLKLRESLFHGVEAIRLNPVGGEDAIHGRDGLLAHTYMLGPSGQSNGCVSFKDYNRFLRAYKNNEIKRLAVIASLDKI